MPPFAPRHLIPAFIALLLLTWAQQAANRSATLWLFAAEGGGNQLRVDGPDRGVAKNTHISDRPFVVQEIDGELSLVNLTFGVTSGLNVQRGGRVLQQGNTRYRLIQPAACLPRSSTRQAAAWQMPSAALTGIIMS